MSETGVSRRTVLKASAVGMGTFGLSGCMGAGEPLEDDESNPIERGVIEDVRIPYLELDTLEAELAGETLQAESYEDLRPGSITYVGEVIGHPYRNLFAGVSLLDDDTEQPDIVSYLCDGEVGTRDAFGLYLTGEHDAGGVTLANEDGEVKLALVDGEFLGATTLADEESFPFLATEATGDAGLYWAEIDPEEGTGLLWVVLPDGRQRGRLRRWRERARSR